MGSKYIIFLLSICYICISAYKHSHNVRSPNIGTFLQIADIHYDATYAVGSPNHCMDDLVGMSCCQNFSIPLPNSTNAQRWGDYNCDSPFSLVENTLKWIQLYFPNIDYILWSGDSATHHITTQTFEDNISAVDDVTTLLKKYFPKIKVYPTIGNHDTWPADNMGEPTYMQAILNNYTIYWG